jgi:glucose/arabinose dehydrogenase
LEKSGGVKIIQNEAEATALTLDVQSDGEMGLLGMALHPDFATNGRVFLHYNQTGSGATTIEEFTLSGDVLTSAGAPLLTVAQPYGNHDGGMIEFGPDGYLYIGLGDGGGSCDQAGSGQDLSSLLGSIVRIDVDAPTASVPGNVASSGGNDGRIFHWGLRNPWRFSFDRLTGDLYVADVGQNDWEEISVLPAGSPGSNFGWPSLEGSADCACCDTNKPPATDDMLRPVHEYGHDGGGGSITGGYVYRGSQISGLQGRYIFADYSTRRIWLMTWDGTQGCDLIDISSNLDPDGQLDTVSSFGEDANGELYVVNLGSGQVFRIDPRLTR